MGRSAVGFEYYHGKVFASMPHPDERKAMNDNNHHRKYILTAALILAAATGCGHFPPFGPPPPPTYEQVLMQTHALEEQYAHGYASIGYSPAIMTIPNRPFTATRTYTEWPENGTPDAPTRTTNFTIARDGAGRVHYENSTTPDIVRVTVSDPIAHTQMRYTLLRRRNAPRVVDRCTQPLMRDITSELRSTPHVQLAGYIPPQQTAAQQDTKEELGMWTIEGQTAFGQLHTWEVAASKYPAKTLQEEQWFAPDLAINVLDRKNFSGQPQTSVATHNLILAEPDPALFQIPDGYTVSPDIPSCVGGR